MALPKTGYTKKSAESFIIDSATIFADVTLDGEDFTGTPLGATSGGVKINIEQSYRKPEVDGAYIMDVVGLEVMESAKATVTGNLLELTAENLRRALNGTMRAAAADEAPAGYKVIETKRYVEESDYLPNMAVVGIHNGTKKPIIVMIDNGLVTSPLNLETEDNKEAVLELEIVAHASFDQLQADKFPWRILYPEVAAPTEPVTEPAKEPETTPADPGTTEGAGE